MKSILVLVAFLFMLSCQQTSTEPDHASTVAGKYKISRYEFPALGYPPGYKLTYDTTVTLTLKRIDNTSLEAHFIYNEANIGWLSYRNYNGIWLVNSVKETSINLTGGNTGYTYKNKQIDIIAGENGPYVSLKKISE